MTLAPGTKLGPYEIVAPLGAGGMGEVYRARDTRLGRDVAVKVLPQHLSANPEVRARFEREAKTVSSLNHPNICTLFDVGREGEVDYLVMELVEGETLAERLKRGALAVPEVLKLGAQVADALDRAHRAGVIHRDLKPGNVMLAKSGAKLMDFGLARATGMAGGSASGSGRSAMTQSPTVAHALTAEGTIVGTFQYMSPEQLEGREADSRSDLWALGCVLYEMATGRRAYEGGTQASLISAIMRDTPRPLTEIAPMSPPELDRLVVQCLAKDPDERWQSAGDVRRELEWIAAGKIAASGSSTAPGLPKRARSGVAGWPVGLAGVVVAVAALVVAFGPWGARRVAAPLARFLVEAPAGTTIGVPAEAALSPDGEGFVFEAYDSGGVTRLYVRALDSPSPRVLPGSEGATLPFWSPDGRFIGFFSQGKLRKVALDGSSPVVLCDAPDPRGGTWSPGGTIVFAPDAEAGLSQVPSGGGEPKPVTRLNKAIGELGHRYPQFLPDGRHFLYTGVGTGDEQVTYSTSLAGGTPAEVCRGGSGAVYVEPGDLLYLDTGVNSRQRRLMVRRFDASSRKASGDPRVVLDDVNANNFGYSNVTASASGVIVAQHWTLAHQMLTWRARSGAAAGTVAEDLDGDVPSLSPDGRRLAYLMNDPPDLALLDLTSGVTSRLTYGKRRLTNIIWSADNRQIAFACLLGARGWELHTKNADGSGPDSMIFHGPGLFSFPLTWAPDGRSLLARVSDEAGNMNLWRVPVSGGGTAEVFERSPATVQSAEISPDGEHVLVSVTDDGRRSVYVRSMTDPGARNQLSLPGLLGATWSRGGKELILLSEAGTLYSCSVSFAGGFQQGVPVALFTMPKGESVVGLDPGSQRFLLAREKPGSVVSRLEVVLGWRHLLERK